MTVTSAALTTEGSACRVASTVIVVDVLTFGAVKSPELVMVPPFAAQLTDVLAVPVTVAVNCWVACDVSVTGEGEMVIETGVGDGGGAFTVKVTLAKVLL